MQPEIWTLKCEIEKWNMIYKFGNMKYEIWNILYDIWNIINIWNVKLEYEIWNLKSVIRIINYEI